MKCLTKSGRIGAYRTLNLQPSMWEAVIIPLHNTLFKSSVSPKNVLKILSEMYNLLPSVLLDDTGIG